MATATATATFTAADTASFTWSPPLTSNPPQVLSRSVSVLDSKGPVEVQIIGAVTNIGGTLQASSAFTGTVTLLGSD